MALDVSSHTSKTQEKIAAAHAQVLKDLLDAMAQGPDEWIQTWIGVRQINATTGKPYRGINSLYLTSAMRKHDYKDPRWITFKQAEREGWHVRSGEKSSGFIEFYSKFYKVQLLDGRKKTLTQEQIEDEIKRGNYSREKMRSECPQSFATVKTFAVFNAEQCEGIPPLEASHIKDINIDRIANQLKSSSRCPVFELPIGEAFYSPSKDSISLPERTRFFTSEGFVRTLLHEMGHSSMAPLERKVDSQGFGSIGYAQEELTAELSAAFVAQDIGLDMHSFIDKSKGQTTYAQNHAAYFLGWAEQIKEEPQRLFSAISDATKAAHYIYERYEEHLVEDALEPVQEKALEVCAVHENAPLAQVNAPSQTLHAPLPTIEQTPLGGYESTLSLDSAIADIDFAVNNLFGGVR